MRRDPGLGLKMRSLMSDAEKKRDRKERFLYAAEPVLILAGLLALMAAVSAEVFWMYLMTAKWLFWSMGGEPPSKYGPPFIFTPALNLFVWIGAAINGAALAFWLRYRYVTY